jgi:N-acetyltransferase
MADERGLQLEPVTDAHKDGLLAACAADTDIWDIYPYSMGTGHFDETWPFLFRPGRLAFAVVDAGLVVGTSSYFLDAPNRCAEIGGTYIQPDRRGSGLNNRMKRLMLARAFESGIETVQLRVDARNGRSRAAVAKLGAHFDGTLRGDRLTWTGHRRDTCVFSILKSEWPGIEATLTATMEVPAQAPKD